MAFISLARTCQRRGISCKAFTDQLYATAAAAQKRIVLPEGTDDRIISAGCQAAKRGLARITVLGEQEAIHRRAKELGVWDESLTGDVFQVFNPKGADSPVEKLAGIMYEKRKAKGMTLEKATEEVVTNRNVFGTLMVASGLVDGMVSGASTTTADTLRPALQLVGTTGGDVSSVMFMLLSDGVYVYADCALSMNPNSDQLAHIAVSSARTARAFNLTPKVAMLSFATGNSNSGPLVDPIRAATDKARGALADEGIMVDGPLQFDAAVNPAIAKKKGAVSGGENNVLVFPDLNCANISYKAVQQTTGCVAMGPVLQGLSRPINDLSRGATIDDVIDTIACTATQCTQA